ncbi:M48 family metallopeptidase [Campylobacter estrildidarum]|uniref:YgjP-like metallopeptidase domain-containing protein n=1 Tax=Campylobacter estrildidarum TaxID=2510189 RepID=A0A4V6DYP4_9BACT|nr:SprT family zinc-dependent metalloprotease [Campylobacter estrildidarum]TKX32002.1 hypothetical protein CQA69_00355 [Campylobacter estrildidarum]
MARQSFGIKEFFWREWVFFYQKKSIKNVYLRLNEKGEFHLSLPYNYALEDIERFLIKNENWIKKTWLKFQNRVIDDESQVYFLGKKYRLVLKENLFKTKILKNEIYTPSRSGFESFLKKNSKIIFLFYLKKWTQKTKLSYTHLSIKKMKTRWGSCNHKKRYINLNLKLLEKSLKAIEYVILHEIAHLKYPNHSQEFYNFLAFYMKDFREREKEFKK